MQRPLRHQFNLPKLLGEGDCDILSKGHKKEITLDSLRGINEGKDKCANSEKRKGNTFSSITECLKKICFLKRNATVLGTTEEENPHREHRNSACLHRGQVSLLPLKCFLGYPQASVQA